MPKYKPTTAKLKAKKLIKSYQRENLNQHQLARVEGVSQSAISQRLSKDPVQKTIIEMLNDAGITDERLTEEHFTVLQSINPKLKLRAVELGYRVKGYIKTNGEKGNGTSVTALIIHIGDKSGLYSRTEAKTLSPGRAEVPALPGGVEKR